MKVFGRDINFLFSVGAQLAVAGLTSDHSPYMRTVACAVILSEQFEKRKAIEEPGYEPRPLTFEEAQALTPEEFEKLCEEMNKAFEEGGVRSVETEEDKKKEAGAQS